MKQQKGFILKIFVYFIITLSIKYFGPISNMISVLLQYMSKL